MARDKKTVVGALNITIQPHTPQRYVDMFKTVYRLGKTAKVYSDRFGVLSTMYPLDRDQGELYGLTGDIFTFTNIDPDAPWFNMATNSVATDDDLGEINIPEHMKPNSARFSYIFFPEEHLLFYEGYYDGNVISPTTVTKFIDRLLNNKNINSEYGIVDVTHVPDKDELTDALQLPFKDSIEMVIHCPNADDFSETEQRVMARMTALNVESKKEIYKARADRSIEMDDELVAMSHVAAKNGSLTVKGKDVANRPVEYKTTEHPWTQTEYYNPDATLPFEIISALARQMKGVITEWFR